MLNADQAAWRNLLRKYWVKKYFARRKDRDSKGEAVDDFDGLRRNSKNNKF